MPVCMYSNLYFSHLHYVCECAQLLVAARYGKQKMGAPKLWKTLFEMYFIVKSQSRC